ncbi:hypothetical protein, partial [Streptomyces cupreus]|uniref:hypothetical protein n=1 Tax=Streptomyces cupreus TaxID=2759956 RepID=UPI001C8FE93C
RGRIELRFGRGRTHGPQLDAWPAAGAMARGQRHSARPVTWPAVNDTARSQRHSPPSVTLPRPEALAGLACSVPGDMATD